MGMPRYERLLAGVAAIALVAAVTPTAYAAPDTPQEIEAAVPVPTPADVPPPSAADVAAPAAASSTTSTSEAPATAAPAPPGRGDTRRNTEANRDNCNNAGCSAGGFACRRQDR